MVKSYLDGRGVTDSVCKDNLPGVDWLSLFINYHNLSQRLSDNVKSSCAEINLEVIIEYFRNLESTLEGIDPSNFFYYDETNVMDNSGVKKVIVRRGLRRVKGKAEHSKQSICIMFCGNAAGESSTRPNMFMPCGPRVVLQVRFMKPHRVVGTIPGHFKYGFPLYFYLT